MALHCKSTLNTLQQSILLSLMITILFFPFISLNSLLTTLFIINLDYILSIDLLSYVKSLLSNTTKLDDQILTVTKDNDNDNKSSTTKKKPILSIDTSSTITHKLSTNEKPVASNSPIELTTTPIKDNYYPKSATIIRKRHCSISSFNQPDMMDFTPSLSPTSSVSSFSSNWSTDSKRSHVEEMIYLFETGGHQHRIHRRYSMDSHNYQKPSYIRERKFEYKPIASEWKKRATNSNSNIQLSASKSTPLRRKMTPIPEKSKSTWA